MNIFFLDRNPAEAAKLLTDKHVVKMIVESCQMLATAHHLLGKPVTYKPTHINHPSSIWVRQSQENYCWLLLHAQAIGFEYKRRYGKDHKCMEYILGELCHMPENLPLGPFYDPPQCVPDDYKDPDPVKAYTRYYLVEKVMKKNMRWKTGIPEKFKSIIKYD